MGRSVDASGLAAWQSALAQPGGSLSTIEASLASSSEAQADINTIYNQVLNRPADAAGTTNWENALAAPGGSLTNLRSAIAATFEAQSKLTAALQTAEGHAPSAADVAAGNVQIAAGLSLNDVITQAMILSSNPTFITAPAPAYGVTTIKGQPGDTCLRSTRSNPVKSKLRTSFRVRISLNQAAVNFLTWLLSFQASTMGLLSQRFP